MWLATPWTWFQNYFLCGVDSWMATFACAPDFSNGGAFRAVEVRQARKTNRASAASRKGRKTLKTLLVDLETAWRGGQNQALLILKGLSGARPRS